MKKRLLVLVAVLCLAGAAVWAATGSGLNWTQTSAMHLLKPIPGVTGGLGVEPSGTSWMELFDRSMDLIDQHDHSPGKGQPVPTSGVNINADLGFNSFNATLLRSLRLNSQASQLAGAGDIRSLYAVGGDLYYNNGAGTAVQVTSGGGVAGTPGSIGGLVSPASVTYTPGSTTYTFQSNTNVAATIDGGPHVIRQKIANANGITLQSPNSLAASYAVTFPTALPAGQQFLSMDATGNLLLGTNVAGGLTAANLSPSAGIAGSQLSASAGITRSQLASVGQQISASCGSASVGAVQADVSGLAVTITTTGRPVIAMMIPDGTTTPGAGASLGTGSGSFNLLFLVRVAAGVPTTLAQWQGGSTQPPPIAPFIDAPAAGTYTYKIQGQTASGSMAVTNWKLSVYEL